MPNIIRIHPKDNVAIALTELIPDEIYEIGEQSIHVTQNIPAGHKVAIAPINESAAIVKYGSFIGHAVCDIQVGEWVHTHNMKTNLSDIIEYTYEPQKATYSVEQEEVVQSENATSHEFEEETIASEETIQPITFQGYRRGNGSVGIRNELWIIPTVGCVNSLVTTLARETTDLKADNIEDVIAFTHPYGCSQLGDDQENTRRILADLIHHPNAGGVLVVGLGCENSGVEILKQYLGTYDEDRVKFLICQQCEDEMEEGHKLLNQLAAYAGSFHRETIDASELIVGLKCGGSDGFSGITANPVVGRFSDLLVKEGGTTILTEVPEMFGAETILMNRCQNQELFQKTVNMINEFKEYFKQNGQTIYENPSPGNKQGGISTLEDKSMGCTQKAGGSPVCGVYGYAERVTTRGLNLLSAPGNDLVASTALAASGAHLILFTTGRGTPFASPVPTIKISSNTELAMKKSNWIDFNAGVILSEGKALDDVGIHLFEQVLRTASGERTRSENAGYHDMAIMKQGVTL